MAIPEGVTSIGESAFNSCGLTSVAIPESVMSIKDSSFIYCSSLTGINVSEGNENYASEQGVLYNKAKTELICCPGGKQGSVTIPGSVTSIGRGAFSGCGNLTSVTIPGSVTSIGGFAFSKCGGLTSVTIPEGVTSIGGGAFSWCESLTSVTISESVTSIEGSAFRFCDKLKDVYYAGSQAQWGQIEIDERENEALQSAAIHYNSSGPSDGADGNNEGGTGGNNGGGSGSDPVQKTAQTITASDLVKTYGVKPFSLGAKSSGTGALSYTASDPKVAAVDGSGKVTIKGCGVTDIVITAAETDACAKAQKTVRLTVKPKKAALVSVKSKKKKTITAKWKKDSAASGYLIECATDKKFKKNKVRVEVKKNKTVTATVGKLKGGSKYYVRICAYAVSGKTKVQGEWSKAKTVKVEK